MLVHLQFTAAWPIDKDVPYRCRVNLARMGSAIRVFQDISTKLYISKC